MISLIPIFAGNEYIAIDNLYKISENYFHGSSILALSDIRVKGNLKKENSEIVLKANVSGSMKIQDSITLDDIWYPFSFDIDENIDGFIEKDEKSLDIIEVLWQNIVLEVPLRYTTVNDYSSYQGDGWKLVSEEELNNNPFKTLLDEKDRSD